MAGMLLLYMYVICTRKHTLQYSNRQTVNRVYHIASVQVFVSKER